MATFRKKDLVDKVAAQLGVKNVTAKEVVQGFLDEIIGHLERGHRLEFRDFGVFETRQCPAHAAYNPRTSGRITVPPKVKVRFKAGGKLRRRLARTVRQPPPPVADGQAVVMPVAPPAESTPASPPDISLVTKPEPFGD